MTAVAYRDLSRLQRAQEKILCPSFCGAPADRNRLPLSSRRIGEIPVRVHAFCLMTNHIHLALQGGDVRQPFQYLACSFKSRHASKVEPETVAQRNRFRSTAATSRALARGCLLPQHSWHLLLPVQLSGWMQPINHPLGNQRADDRTRY